MAFTMTDETLDGWLDAQIEFADNEIGMLRSYRKDDTRQYGEALGRRNALKEVREKLAELWGDSHGETEDGGKDAL